MSNAVDAWDIGGADGLTRTALDRGHAILKATAYQHLVRDGGESTWEIRMVPKRIVSCSTNLAVL